MSGMMTPVEQNQFDNAGVARWRTQQFQERLEQTRNILRPALNLKFSIEWEKSTGNYPVPQPPAPVYLECPPNFAILERNELTYIQTALSVKGSFELEYQDGTLNAHYCCTSDLTLEDVTKAFQAYAKGEEGMAGSI